MLNLLPVLALLVTPIVADLTVPVTITGVSTGNLNLTGNIVANVDRILATLNQFQSIVQSLYYIQTPELSPATDNFRYVLDSLVETGSPIFQALSNVAKVSSGNVTRSFEGIKTDIKNAIALNEQHVALVNQTRALLGDASTDYFDATLYVLAITISNVPELLDEIQGAIVQIQQLNPKTQDGVNTLLPNNAITQLNALLRQYITIGDSAIPQIRSVVSRIQSVDGFVTRIRGVFDQRRRDLNSTAMGNVAPYVKNSVIDVLVSGITSLRKQIVERSTKSAIGVSSLILSDNEFVKYVANQDVLEIQAFGAEVVNVTDRLVAKVNGLKVKYDLPTAVMNSTQQQLDEVIQAVSLMMTQRVNKSDTCFSQYNNLFDAVPRTVYSQLYDCLWSTAYDLNQVARYWNTMISLAGTDAAYRMSAVDKCSNMITKYSTDITKYQAASCLIEVKKLLANRAVFQEQLANFEKLLENEVAYSSQRYDFCLQSSLQQAYTQVVYLRGSFGQCVGLDTPIKPMKIRVHGSVTISF